MPTAPLAHYLTIRRTARYYTFGGEGGARSVWYVLHGYRQLADRFIRNFAVIANPSRMIVAPEALNRFYLDDGDGRKAHGPDSPVGATWMTRHDREAEIADYVAYLDELDGSLGLDDGMRRIVLGFSQGAATATRWAALGQQRLDRLVLWGGILPHDLPVEDHVERLQPLAPVIVCGERDPALSIERAEAEVARLGEHEIGATVLRYPVGHVVTSEALKRLAELVDQE